jgi:hypothetical protein
MWANYDTFYVLLEDRDLYGRKELKNPTRVK